MREVLKCFIACLIIIVWGIGIYGTASAHTYELPKKPVNESFEIVKLPEPEKTEQVIPEVRLVSFEDSFAVDPIIRNLTEQEKNELRLIAEAEDLIDGTEGMLWVMLTVINRIRVNGGTVHSTIYAPSQYYTAGMADAPSPASEEALEMLMCGTDPSNGARYFRTGNYHEFGTPVAQIGHHYYSK